LVLLPSGGKGKTMTAEEREQMEELCRQIQVEKDQAKFTALIEELNRLLAQKDERLQKTSQ
jgi:hypothetical protein